MISPLIFIAVAAYLLGAVPFALLISRAAGLPDPRSYGSGNVGATNVARSGSKTAAILTLFADGGKGALAVLGAAAAWGAVAGEESATAAAMAPAIAGGSAVLGHVTSPFLRFRGGRGVATALAVYLCWLPAVGAAALAVWALVFAVSRYSSLASLSAATVATILFALYAPLSIFIAAVVVNIIIIIRHQDNLRRLVRGSEQGFR